MLCFYYIMKKKNEVYYLNVLEALSKKSTCNRAAMTAIIIRENVIISTGYNGAPRKIKHCNKKHIMYNNHCINTTHAEINAIINCVKIGVSIENCEMISLYKPCYNCIKVLINSGISTCYYFKDYTDSFQKYFEKNEIIKFIKI